MKRAINIIYTTMMLVLLLGCKKYPENKWPIILVPPEVTLKKLSGAKLKSYTVNGADSIPVLEQKHPNWRDLIFAYGPNGDRMSSSFYRNYGWNLIGRPSQGFLNFSDDKKYLTCNADPFPFSNMKVIKLTSKELIVRAEKNNKIYEIHFSK